MSRIDHAAEAMKMMKASLSDPVANHPQGMTASNALVARAQVEATLALVEQQRIANLIALSTPQELIGGGEVSVPSWSVEPKTGWKNIGQQEIKLRPDIAAALGLTAGQEGQEK